MTKSNKKLAPSFPPFGMKKVTKNLPTFKKLTKGQFFI
jgi:hypothetical protein